MDSDRADDLVQETIVRALDFIDRFEPGTNLQAWMFTILRNQFHTGWRRRRRAGEDADGAYAAKLATAPEQETRMQFEDLRGALARLSPDQREAIILIGAEGFSYEEAAEICQTKVGTIKSRVNRARTRLAEMLGRLDEGELGADPLVRAALAA
jgi:RNA polymerase sigma-70 factor (ECF subfamily)